MTTTPPAQPAPVVPATHKLVPIEPSPAMLVALWDHREAMRGHSENKIARAGYAAMLAAAPQPLPPAPDIDAQKSANLRDNAASHQRIEVAQQERQPLSEAEIEKLRDQTFSINNPFCPCDSKTMRKAVRAAERAHGITGEQP